MAENRAYVGEWVVGARGNGHGRQPASSRTRARRPSPVGAGIGMPYD
jgi:hypothetical protein